MGQVEVRMTGDEARLFKSLSRVIAKETEMAGKFGEISKKAKAAGNEVDRSFGGKAIGAIHSWAAGMTSGAAAVGVLRSALADMRQEAAGAGQDLKKLVDTNVTLNQVANSGKDLANFQKQRDELATKYGMSPDEVASLLFAARSEGFEPLVEKIVSARQVVPPTEAATVAGQVPTLFQGKITGEQALNATLKAAGISRLDFAPMAQALPKAAEGAAPAGSSPAEVMALASVFASNFASGDTMSDRLKGFGARLAMDERFRGKGILGGFEELQGMSKEDRQDFLGQSQELNAVYFLLEQNAGRVAEVQREVEQAIKLSGTAQSELAKGIARATANPELRATFASERAAIALEVQRRQAIGESGLSGTAAQDALLGEMYGAGESQLKITAAKWAADFAQNVTRDPDLVRGAGLGGARATDQFAANTLGGPVVGLLSNILTELKASNNRPPRTQAQPSRRAAQLQERNAQRE